MDIIEKYQTYRKAGMELTHKIIHSCLDRDILMKSARLLGIVHEDILVFDKMDEINVIMDFALHEYRVNNKNAVEIYREKTGFENEMEKEILDALLLSYTSLFKVASISSAENTILLNDILNKKDNIKLTDIAFSKTAFPGGTEEHLLKRYTKLSKKIKSASESIKRFVIFFRLNKTYGIEVRFE